MRTHNNDDDDGVHETLCAASVCVCVQKRLRQTSESATRRSQLLSLGSGKVALVCSCWPVVCLNLCRLAQGVLAAAGRSAKLVFHAVADVTETSDGPDWGEHEQRVCKIVFIGKKLDRKKIEDRCRWLPDAGLARRRPSSSSMSGAVALLLGGPARSTAGGSGGIGPKLEVGVAQNVVGFGLTELGFSRTFVLPAPSDVAVPNDKVGLWATPVTCGSVFRPSSPPPPPPPCAALFGRLFVASVTGVFPWDALGLP